MPNNGSVNPVVGFLYTVAKALVSLFSNKCCIVSVLINGISQGKTNRGDCVCSSALSMPDMGPCPLYLLRSCRLLLGFE